MNRKYFVTDTHPLIWYLLKKDKKIPRNVFSAFQMAQEGGDSHIWVPAAVAWEISLLLRKPGKLTITGTFDELIAGNFYFKNLSITEIQLGDIAIAHSLNFNKDPFDGLIVATANRLDLPLISADEAIVQSKACSIFWRYGCSLGLHNGSKKL